MAIRERGKGKGDDVGDRAPPGGGEAPSARARVASGRRKSGGVHPAAVLAGMFVSALVVSALASAAVGASRAEPPRGRLATVGHFGQQLHVDCVGADGGSAFAENGRGLKGRSGDPLFVVFHGSGLDSSLFWHATATRVAGSVPGATVCVVDRPMHGHSPAFEGSRDEYAGRRARAHAAEAAEALAALHILPPVSRGAPGGDDADDGFGGAAGDRAGRSSSPAARTGAVVAVGAGTGAYEARFFARLVDATAAISVEPAARGSPYHSGEHFTAMRSLHDVLGFAALSGLGRWAHAAGVHPFSARFEAASDPAMQAAAAEVLASRSAFSAAVLDDRFTEDILSEFSKSGAIAATASAVIVGADAGRSTYGDSGVRERAVKAMRNENKGSRFIEVPNARHWIHVDNPNGLASSIIKAVEL